MDNTVQFNFNDIVRIQGIGFHSVDSVYAHPNRVLDWNVFIYIVTGAMEVWEEGKEYVAESGQFLFLKAGLHHWGDLKTPAGTSWYWIHFYNTPSHEPSLEFSQFVDSYQTISYEEYNRHIVLPKHGGIRQVQLFENKLDVLNCLFASSEPFRAITLSLQTMKLFLDVYEDYRGVAELSKSDRTVQRVIEYLEHKDTHDLSSKDIEARLQMNYAYLCRVFKMKTKSTIHDYNTRIFVDKAMKMMRDTHRNVSEISDHLGFSSPFYFSRIFKAAAGCTPTEYINSVRSQVV